MGSIIPENVNNLRLLSKQLAAELDTVVKKGGEVWTDEQAKQLGKIYQILQNTHDALYAVADANKED